MCHGESTFSVAFLLHVERTVERVLIRPAAWVEVPDVAELEVRGAIALGARDVIAVEVPDAAELEARGAIVVGGAVAVDTEDELRSAGLARVCSAVQGEPGAVAGVGQDGFGVVAGLVAPAVRPAWFRAGRVASAVGPVWFRVEWVVPVVEPDESRVARDEFETGLDGWVRRASCWADQGLAEQDEFQAVWGGLAGRLADQDVQVVRMAGQGG